VSAAAEARIEQSSAMVFTNTNFANSLTVKKDLWKNGTLYTVSCTTSGYCSLILIGAKRMMVVGLIGISGILL